MLIDKLGVTGRDYVMPAFIDLTGKRYGRLVVIERAPNDDRFNKVRWLCLCDCGKLKTAYANRLQQRPDLSSCGCLATELAAETARRNFTIHGLTDTDECDMWHRAKARAREEGAVFTLTVHDIHIPEFCPALGIRLSRHKGVLGPMPDSPSLDRLIPELGYTKDNSRVISNKANSIKQRATSAELLRIAEWLSSELGAVHGVAKAA